MQVRGIPLPGLAHPSPLLQMSPEQHTSPLAPHGSQVIPPSPVWQERLEVQALSLPPAQQISLLLPQPTQVPPEQRAPAAVQVVEPPPNPPPAPLPQQVWPTAPHVVPVVVWHDPLEQVPLVPAPVHADPPPTHIPAMQHPLPWQLFVAQQA
jgi:hypothetical protein